MSDIIVNLSEALEKALARIDSLEAELDGINENHARRIRLLQDDRAKAERRAEQAEAEVARLKAEVESCRDEFCGDCEYLHPSRWAERGTET